MDFLSPTLSLSTAACPAWSGPPYIWQSPSFIFLSLSLSLSSLITHSNSLSHYIGSKAKILTWVSIESDRPQKRAFSFNTTLHSQLPWRSRGTCHRCCRLTSIGFAFCFEFAKKRAKKKNFGCCCKCGGLFCFRKRG